MIIETVILQNLLFNEEYRYMIAGTDMINKETISTEDLDKEFSDANTV